MFDIGLSEILIVGIVALVVLGPERLPKAARLAGFWVRKARAQWYSVKAELESEIADEEIKSSLKESMSSLQETLKEHQTSLQHDMHSLNEDLQNDVSNIQQELRLEEEALIPQETHSNALPPSSNEHSSKP